MATQRKPEATVQEEIKKEDEKFMTGGIFFVAGGLLFALLLIFLLLRFIIFPLFRSMLGAFKPSPTTLQMASPAPIDDTEPVIKDVDAVPYNWEKVTIPEIGILLARPPEATISASGNKASLKLGNTTMQFVQKSMASTDMEDEVANIRNKLNDKPNDTTLVEKTEIAGISGYGFVIEKSPKEQHLFLPQQQNKFLEIIIPDLSKDEKTRAIIDDILASIEPAEDNSPIETLDDAK